MVSCLFGLLAEGVYMSGMHVRFHGLVVFPVWMCFFGVSWSFTMEVERRTNASIVDQNVNSSTEELRSILDFVSYAIYTLVMEPVKG
jgi:hypothetical protein